MIRLYILQLEIKFKDARKGRCQMNDKLRRQETEEELLERFDKEMRAALLEEANRLRKEKGYPLITEEDVSDIDTLSKLKEYGKNE